MEMKMCRSEFEERMREAMFGRAGVSAADRDGAIVNAS